jgi:D-3-phosphoglycerate dehydrogenase
MPRVVVLDELSPEGLALLDAEPRIDYEVRTGLAGDALRGALAEFDGAICRSGVKLSAEVLEGNRRLKAIVRAGVGTDNIDRQAATRAGIVVMNTPAGNTVSTAEHTMALMLALSRNIPAAYQSLVEGRWERSRHVGAQLAGKTLGVVGMGRIGQAVAQRAKALEMRVLAYDPFLAKERMRDLGVEPMESIDTMLPQVDYLTVHTPLTDETRSLIGRAQIDKMRRGVRLINCARGGIYDEAALVDGLRSGKLAGVALDVFATEPCPASPLFGMPGVICTPHLGASTEEAQAQVAQEAVQLLVAFLTTGAIRHAVNVAAIDPKTLEGLRGFLDVAYRLGLLLAGWHQGGVTACHVLYRGEIAGKDTKVLTAALAAGLLEHALDEEVNVVNAEFLLRERGIELVEQSRSDMGAFSSAMTAEVRSAHRTHRATGTVFGQRMPRLVELEDYRLEAYLDGWLMVFTHRDVPGIIGSVGTIFGQHNVNIAQMAVGRKGHSPGGDAIGVLNLDNEPSDAALLEVRSHPAISSATVIRLPEAGHLPAWMG